MKQRLILFLLGFFNAQHRGYYGILLVMYSAPKGLRFFFKCKIMYS